MQETVLKVSMLLPMLILISSLKVPSWCFHRKISPTRSAWYCPSPSSWYGGLDFLLYAYHLRTLIENKRSISRFELDALLDSMQNLEAALMRLWVENKSWASGGVNIILHSCLLSTGSEAITWMGQCPQEWFPHSNNHTYSLEQSQRTPDPKRLLRQLFTFDCITFFFVNNLPVLTSILLRLSTTSVAFSRRGLQISVTQGTGLCPTFVLHCWSDYRQSAIIISRLIPDQVRVREDHGRPFRCTWFHVNDRRSQQDCLLWGRRWEGGVRRSRFLHEVMLACH